MSEDANDPTLFWVDPRYRGVFPLDQFHASRSLRRKIRQGGYQIGINTQFEAVLRHCADRETTWINQTIFDLYIELNRMGFAHSFEIIRDGALIGGVYGVALGSAFFGESMFSNETDGSKLALYHLIAHLNDRRYSLFDTQFITDHLQSLGAVEISRDEYHHQLNAALQEPREFI